MQKALFRNAVALMEEEPIYATFIDLVRPYTSCQFTNHVAETIPNQPCTHAQPSTDAMSINRNH